MGRWLRWTLGIGLMLELSAAPAAAQTHVSGGIGIATPYGGGTVIVGGPAYPYPYRYPYARLPYPVYPPAYAMPVYPYPPPYRAYDPAYPYYGPAYGGAVVVGGYRGHAYARSGYGHGYGHGHHAGGGHGHGHH